MRMYTMIDSDAKLADLQSQWKEKGISIVAMDFEGE
ncbi:MAG: 3'-5' exonuclease, partial [Spirochaetales bacterium]|nr:3'-5' exonuclease [Spirochaetales bacterium]